MEHYVLLCTGGIGCGKSFVTGVFNALGIPSYDCDGRVKAFYDTVPSLPEQISSSLGGGFLDENGKLDRRKLAAVVFSDRKALDIVEGIVHPLLKNDFEKWKNARDSFIVVIESAILLEKQLLSRIPDGVLTVTAPPDIRIERVMERDGSNENEVLGRMNNQIADEERLKKTDFTIRNDGRQALLPQILNIIKEIENGKDRS